MMQNLALNVHARNIGRSHGPLSAMSDLALDPTNREAPADGRARQAEIPQAYVIPISVVAYLTNEIYQPGS